MREFAAVVGSEERLKLLCLMTLADVDAVSPETLTRWKEDLLWRVYVDTYNCLTLQYGDDVIERTRDRRRRMRRAPAAGSGSREVAQAPRGAAAPLPAAVRSQRRLRPRSTGARHPPRRSAPAARAGGGGVGADRGDARQADAVREHLRRAVVVRHGHPARPRDDEPERTGARRLPVRRRRALPGAERGRVRRRAARDRGRGGGPLDRGGPPARPPARPQAAPRRRRRARRPRRRCSVAPVHRARDRRAGRARPALPHQPRDLGARVRDRSRADLDRRGHGDRRVSHHAGEAPS